MADSLIPFSQRHPILKQAWDDACRLSWQQVGVPTVSAIATLLVSFYRDYYAGRLDLLNLKNLGWSLLVGVVLYVIIAVARAPFVVIGRLQRELLEVRQGLAVSTGNPLFLPDPRGNTKLVQLEPNILASEPEFHTAHNDEDGVIVEGETIERPYGRSDPFWNDSNEDFVALVVPLFNHLTGNKEVGEIDRISAQVSYRLYDSEKYSREVAHVAWLSNEESYVDFRRDATHRLIIATLEENSEGKEPDVFAVTRAFFGSRKGVETRRIPLSNGVIGVTISLKSEALGRIVKTFKYMLEKDWSEEEAVRLVLPSSWKREKLLEFEIEANKLNIRFSEGETEEELMPVFLEWQERVGRFLETYSSVDDKRIFLPPPFEPQKGTKPAWAKQLFSALEPKTFNGKVTAKIDALKRIRGF